jgi:SAM-dependent methyltransferase
MSFEVGADAYGRFMGRYSEPLAAQFLDFAGVRQGQRALDVGCGPGALTVGLVARLGSAGVTAIDPSETFVAALHARLPEVDVRRGGAEALPFADDQFDVALAQLVVHFMTDPQRGLAEMARVTRSGGVVAGCVWDHGGGRGPLSLFWRAVHDVDPGARDEAGRAGASEGDLVALLRRAGLQDVQAGALTVRVRFPTFEDWWEPFTLGVGPAGRYVGGLPAERRDQLRAHCAELFPDPPFDVEAWAWAAHGRS